MEQSSTETATQNVYCSSLVSNKCIQRGLSMVLLLLAVFLFAETIKSFKEYKYVGGGVSPSNIISVSGGGEVFAVPDTAEFTFTIFEEAATAKEVQDAATKKANESIQALKEKGVEDKDIKTVNYALSPKYEWQTDVNCLRYPCPKNRKQVGFTLSQSMEVKVRNEDSAASMLEIVTEKGVSNVSGLTFTVADEDEIRAEARKQAIDDAKAKAEKLAQDLGVSIVRIVGFSEGGMYRAPLMYKASAEYDMEEAGFGGGMTSDTIPVGENKFTSEVSITYEIR
jgi:uncharacterized protein